MLPASISGLIAAARDLTTLRIHRNDTQKLVLQHLDNGRSVSFVFDELCHRARPTRRKLPHREQRRGKIHLPADLLAEKEAGPNAAPDLPHHVVGCLQVFECYPMQAKAAIRRKNAARGIQDGRLGIQSTVPGNP